MVTPVASKTALSCLRGGLHKLPFSWLDILWFCLFLVMRAAWVSSEFLIKCVGTLRSFPPTPSLSHYALLLV